MRAGRLISMVLILQRRGRVTAAELGNEFGVSIRTVLRDVQALHEAGIPLYTSQGSGGGIELIGGYRTILTGLSVDEAAAVFLLGQPALARSLGLATPAASARRKVLEALAPGLRNRAESIDDWLLHDPAPWGPAEPLPLDRLGSAIRRRLVAVVDIPLLIGASNHDQRCGAA